MKIESGPTHATVAQATPSHTSRGPSVNFSNFKPYTVTEESFAHQNHHKTANPFRSNFIEYKLTSPPFNGGTAKPDLVEKSKPIAKNSTLDVRPRYARVHEINKNASFGKQQASLKGKHSGSQAIENIQNTPKLVLPDSKIPENLQPSQAKTVEIRKDTQAVNETIASLKKAQMLEATVKRVQNYVPEKYERQQRQSTVQSEQRQRAIDSRYQSTIPDYVPERVENTHRAAIHPVDRRKISDNVPTVIKRISPTDSAQREMPQSRTVMHMAELPKHYNSAPRNGNAVIQPSQENLRFVSEPDLLVSKPSAEKQEGSSLPVTRNDRSKPKSSQARIFDIFAGREQKLHESQHPIVPDNHQVPSRRESVSEMAEPMRRLHDNVPGAATPKQSLENASTIRQNTSESTKIIAVPSTEFIPKTRLQPTLTVIGEQLPSERNNKQRKPSTSPAQIFERRQGMLAAKDSPSTPEKVSDPTTEALPKPILLKELAIRDYVPQRYESIAISPQIKTVITETHKNLVQDMKRKAIPLTEQAATKPRITELLTTRISAYFEKRLKPMKETHTAPQAETYQAIAQAIAQTVVSEQARYKTRTVDTQAKEVKPEPTIASTADAQVSMLETHKPTATVERFPEIKTGIKAVEVREQANTLDKMLFNIPSQDVEVTLIAEEVEACVMAEAKTGWVIDANIQADRLAMMQAALDALAADDEEDLDPQALVALLYSTIDTIPDARKKEVADHKLLVPRLRFLIQEDLGNGFVTKREAAQIIRGIIYSNPAYAFVEQETPAPDIHEKLVRLPTLRSVPKPKIPAAA